MASSTAADLVVRSGVEPSESRLEQAHGYLARTRRARWIGLACGLVAGFGPLAGEEHGSLVIPRLLAGYLFGVLLSELLAPRPARGAVRAAVLAPRSSARLVPVWTLALAGLFLLPLLATPLLAVGTHPRGVTRYKNAQGDCFGRAFWPHTATLIGIAALAAGALLLLFFTLRRLSQRSQPAEDSAALTLDRALRARSARGAVAAASAMGLTLLALVGQYVNEGIHSYDCNLPFVSQMSTVGNVYSWGDAVSSWLPALSLALLLAAIPTWMIIQRLPTPGSDA